MERCIIDEELENEVFDTLKMLRGKSRFDAMWLKDLKAFETSTCACFCLGVLDVFCLSKEQLQKIIGDGGLMQNPVPIIDSADLDNGGDSVCMEYL